MSALLCSVQEVVVKLQELETIHLCLRVKGRNKNEIFVEDINCV